MLDLLSYSRESVMSDLLFSSIIGAGAGIIGTGIGGAIGFILKRPSKRLISILMSFSAGLMIAVVCFDLLPESFAIGSLYTGIIGVVLGALAIIICEDLIAGYRQSNGRGRAREKYVEMGILLGIGIALHNFPEGLAIGSGFTALPAYGLGLSLVIALHDIPEGIAMATPMVIGGVGKVKIFLSAILAGIPTGIGAAIGYMLGEISPVFISLCLGFAGGAMLYITCSELIPESQDLYRGKVSSLSLIMGLIAGIIISRMVLS